MHALVDPQMEQLGKGIVRTTQMGGQMHKCGISKFNQDVIKACTYCEEDECTSDHLRWKCKYFDEKRRQIDEDIAEIPDPVAAAQYKERHCTRHENRREGNLLGQKLRRHDQRQDQEAA